MNQAPNSKCGFTWPKHHSTGDPPRHQSCCYRDTLKHLDRCVWHAELEDGEIKTTEALVDSLVSPNIHEQTQPVGELLDGAKLSGVEFDDSISLKRISFRDADFSDATLREVKLAQSNLRNADLTSANIQAANLSNVNLRSADLTETNLGRADLTDANLYQTKLTNGHLSRADLAGANLESADLQQANLGGADLTGVILGRANLTKATLQGAVLTDASFGRADVTGASFYESDLTEAYFGRAEMADARFENADLTGANLGHANVVDANFRHAKLSETNLGRADLTGSKLGHVDLSGATVDNAVLADTILVNANLTGATLRRVDLTGANLESANISSVDLSRTDATGASFVGSDLIQSDLYKVTLTGTDLRDCDLSGSDLRETTLSELTVNQGTRCGKQILAEQAAGDAPAWDAIARTYNNLKSIFSSAGLVEKARQYHVLERRARGFEARETGTIGGYICFGERRLPSLSPDGGDIRSYGMYISSVGSRVTTGFGVRPLRLVLWMLFLFGTGAVLYEIDPGITDSVYYSVVTFTTAPPPGSKPTIPVVRAIELIETFGGTLLVVLLGYVLGNRERF